MQRSPLASVILPTHNRPELLLEAIRSIAAQSLVDWQAIIVDDASVPAVNEQQIREQFGPRFQVIRHPVPRGGAAAKNTGAMAATGAFLAFLDDDDLYAPAYLQTAVDILQTHPQITTLFMAIQCFGSNAEWAQKDYGRSMQKLIETAQGIQTSDELLQFDKRLFSALLQSVPMAFQRPVTKRERFLEVGMYQPDCLLWDCDWALRAALDKCCGLLQTPLYLQRTSDQNWSSKPSRRLDHSLSELAIKKQLLAGPRAFQYKKPIKQSTRNAARNVAWEYMVQGKNFKAFLFLLGALRYGIDFLQFKFLAHALYSGLRNSCSL